jgi:hypothetical protein
VTADLFLLTAMSLWEWLALVGGSAVVCASAVWMHRRDRRRLP